MANNKVQLSNGTVIIDLASDTVTSANHIKKGLVGHLADGTTATGTLEEKDVKSVTYNLSGGATASLETSEVVTSQGYSVKLKAPAGFALSNVAITMAGADITSQVFAFDEIGGGGSTEPNSYTRTEILSSQSFTPSSSNKRATLTGLSEGFTDGTDYIVTYDGAEWFVTCETLWSSNYTIGQAQYFLNTSSFDSTEPFGIIWTNGTTCTIAVGDTSQHTVRIEKLTFDGDPLALVQKSVTENGTYNAVDDNADGYSSVTVDIESTPSMNVQMYNGYDYSTTTTYSATDVTLTVKKTGTYDISWVGWRNTTSGTSGSRLYINGVAYGSETTSFQGSYGQSVNLTNVSLTEGDVLVVRARARSTSYRMYVANLVIVQTS